MDITAGVGSQVKLCPVISPDNAVDKVYSLSSSDSSIAEIRNGNKAYIKKSGTAVIDAVSHEGSKHCTYNITAYDRVNYIYITPPLIYLYKVGQTQQLSTIVSPSTSEDLSIAYSSTNTSVATVDSNGLVTCKGYGTCGIVATSLDTGVSNTAIFCSEASNNFLNALEINDSGTINGSINTGGDYDFYKFRASTSGYYIIQSQSPSNIDLFGAVYDAYGTLLTSDDQSGGNSQFRIDNYKFMGSNYYYLLVRGYSSSVTGDYSITITKAVPVTGISLPSTINLVGKQNYNVIPTIQPSNATNTRFTLTTSNSSIIDVYGTSFCGYCSGTATITVTTEDGGYTATSTVYIADSHVTSISIVPPVNMYYNSQFGTTGTPKSDNTGIQSSAQGVAVDSQGNVYVADTNNHRIIKLNNSLQYLSQFGVTGTKKTDNTGLSSPYGVAVDSSGNVFIADTGNHRVVKLNSSLQYVSQFGVTGTLKTDNTGLYTPKGVAVDSSGNVYIADTYNHRLVKLNSSLQYVSQFGVTGTIKNDTTGLNYPQGVAVDSYGNVYIADTKNGRIIKLNSSFQYIIRDSLPMDNTIGVAIDSYRVVFIIYSSFNYVAKADSNLIYSHLYTGTEKTNNTPFKTTTGIAVDASGNIFVVDSGNCRVEKFVQALKVGDYGGLLCAFNPPYAFNQNANYTNSNNSVASMQNGFAGVAAGYTTVTAIAQDGGYSSSCTIQVIN